MCLLDEINQYAGSDSYIVTLIFASILYSGFSSGTNMIPDHWIVWTDKLRDINGNPIRKLTDQYNTEVQLKFFSWGVDTQQLRIKLTLYDFMKSIFFAFVIKREKF